MKTTTLFFGLVLIVLIISCQRAELKCYDNYIEEQFINETKLVDVEVHCLKNVTLTNESCLNITGSNTECTTKTYIREMGNQIVIDDKGFKVERPLKCKTGETQYLETVQVLKIKKEKEIDCK